MEEVAVQSNANANANANANSCECDDGDCANCHPRNATQPAAKAKKQQRSPNNRSSRRAA